MNRKAITEPPSSNATPSTIPMLPPRSPLRSIAAGLRSSLTSCAAMMLFAPYCAPFAPRESRAQCVAAHAPRKGKVPIPSDFSMPDLAPELHHIADHLGHRPVMLRRDFLIYFDGRVQRARQRRILDHRDIVLGGDLADF